LLESIASGLVWAEKIPLTSDFAPANEARHLSDNTAKVEVMRLATVTFTLRNPGRMEQESNKNQQELSL